MANDGGLHDVLKVGKNYIIQKSLDGSIYVIADNGRQYGFSTKRFKLTGSRVCMNSHDTTFSTNAHISVVCNICGSVV